MGRRRCLAMASVACTENLVVVVLLLLTRYPLQDSTLWALGYSERAFRDVTLGDKGAVVLKKVGPPLRSEACMLSSGSSARAHGTEKVVGPGIGSRWSYTAPEITNGSCAYHIREIVFDPDGSVVGKEARFISD